MQRLRNREGSEESEDREVGFLPTGLLSAIKGAEVCYSGYFDDFGGHMVKDVITE